MNFGPKLIVIGMLLCCATSAGASENADDLVERGRYLAKVTGCNDCHTAGYTQAGGQIDENLWLTGDQLGWRGPWGTSYSTNLRLRVAEMSLDQWLTLIEVMQPRPPMPWFNLRAMTREDQTALFQYLKHLGPAGEPAPEWLPPDQTPPPPFVQFPG